jgi:hypothetical protein
MNTSVSVVLLAAADMQQWIHAFSIVNTFNMEK